MVVTSLVVAVARKWVWVWVWGVVEAMMSWLWVDVLHDD